MGMFLRVTILAKRDPIIHVKPRFRVFCPVLDMVGNSGVLSTNQRPRVERGLPGAPRKEAGSGAAAGFRSGKHQRHGAAGKEARVYKDILPQTPTRQVLGGPLKSNLNSHSLNFYDFNPA